MQGSVIIDFKSGWACSNDAAVVIERHLMTDKMGNKFSRHKETIRAMCFLNVFGGVKKDDIADAVFKEDDSGIQKAYVVKVIGITEEMLVLEVLKSTDNQKEIIKNIKGGYNYGK